MRAKRNFSGSNPMPDSAPESLTTWRTPARLARVDEGALGLDHLRVGRGDHERPLDAVKRRTERLGPQHVALHDLHAGQRVERPCPRATSDQRPDVPPMVGKLAHHGKAAQTCRTCDQQHGDLLSACSRCRPERRDRGPRLPLTCDAETNQGRQKILERILYFAPNPLAGCERLERQMDRSQGAWS